MGWTWIWKGHGAARIGFGVALEGLVRNLERPDGMGSSGAWRDWSGVLRGPSGVLRRPLEGQGWSLEGPWKGWSGGRAQEGREDWKRPERAGAGRLGCPWSWGGVWDAPGGAGWGVFPNCPEGLEQNREVLE